MDLNFLQESYLLNALGNTILQSLWQSLLLWIIYETIVLIVKNINAKSKHDLSVLFIFASFSWFTYTFISKLFTTVNTGLVVKYDVTATAENMIPGSWDQLFFYAADALPFLSLAYLFLLIFFIFKLIVAYREVNLVVTKNLVIAPVYLQNFASKVAAQIKVPQKIKIWLSNHIQVPATIGFIKPVILIPISSINHLSTDQLEAIILHELSHIKRNDYLVNLIVTFIETILFFNPFIALFVKNLRKERENCCDDFVLQYKYDAHSYASALLKLEKNRSAHPQLSLAAVSGKKQLYSRIKRITGANTLNNFNYLPRLLALIIFTGLFCLLNFALPTSFSKESKETKALQKKPDPKIEFLKNEVAITIDQVKKIKRPDLKSSDEGRRKPAPIKKPNKPGLEKDNTNNLADEIASTNYFKYLPSDKDMNINVRIDYKPINEALQLALKEIKNVDWKVMEKDINKSLESLKKQKFFSNQKELNEIFKNIPQIKIDLSQLEAHKIFQNFSVQQSIRDSLQAAGFTLMQQKSARKAMSQSKLLEKMLNDSTVKWLFSYNTDTRKSDVSTEK